MRITAARSFGLTDLARAYSRPSGEGAVADLSRLAFIDPAGLVAIACMFEAATDADSSPLELRGPTEADTARYLSRMGLKGAAPDVVAGVDALPPVRHHDQEGNLLSLQRFDSEHGAEELAGMVFNKLEGSADNYTVEALFDGIAELGANTIQHAESEGGFLCAQVYKRSTPDEYLTFAVGDVGIGLRRSLQARHGVNSDAEAIELALERDVSGTGEPGRGQGLAEIVQTARRVQGKVVVQSGTANVTSLTNGPQVAATSSWPGTLVAVRLPCRPG